LRGADDHGGDCTGVVVGGKKGGDALKHKGNREIRETRKQGNEGDREIKGMKGDKGDRQG
jgi:hypothetical protein